jgi:hypothetical protein
LRLKGHALNLESLAMEFSPNGCLLQKIVQVSHYSFAKKFHLFSHFLSFPLCNLPIKNPRRKKALNLKLCR